MSFDPCNLIITMKYKVDNTDKEYDLWFTKKKDNEQMSNDYIVDFKKLRTSNIYSHIESSLEKKEKENFRNKINDLCGNLIMPFSDIYLPDSDIVNKIINYKSSDINFPTNVYPHYIMQSLYDVTGIKENTINKKNSEILIGRLIAYKDTIDKDINININSEEFIKTGKQRDNYIKIIKNENLSDNINSTQTKSVDSTDSTDSSQIKINTLNRFIILLHNLSLISKDDRDAVHKGNFTFSPLPKKAQEIFEYLKEQKLKDDTENFLLKYKTNMYNIFLNNKINKNNTETDNKKYFEKLDKFLRDYSRLTKQQIEQARRGYDASVLAPDFITEEQRNKILVEYAKYIVDSKLIGTKEKEILQYINVNPDIKKTIITYYNILFILNNYFAPIGTIMNATMYDSSIKDYKKTTIRIKSISPIFQLPTIKFHSNQKITAYFKLDFEEITIQDSIVFNLNIIDLETKQKSIELKSQDFRNYGTNIFLSENLKLDNTIYFDKKINIDSINNDFELLKKNNNTFKKLQPIELYQIFTNNELYGVINQNDKYKTNEINGIKDYNKLFQKYIETVFFKPNQTIKHSKKGKNYAEIQSASVNFKNTFSIIKKEKKGKDKEEENYISKGYNNDDRIFRVEESLDIRFSYWDENNIYKLNVDLNVIHKLNKDTKITFDQKTKAMFSCSSNAGVLDKLFSQLLGNNYPELLLTRKINETNAYNSKDAGNKEMLPQEENKILDPKDIDPKEFDKFANLKPDPIKGGKNNELKKFINKMRIHKNNKFAKKKNKVKKNRKDKKGKPNKIVKKKIKNLINKKRNYKRNNTLKTSKINRGKNKNRTMKNLIKYYLSN